MRRTTLLVVTTILAVAMLGSAGCRRVKLTDTPSGQAAKASTESTTVPLGAAEALDVTVRMAMGVLDLKAGEPSSTAALDAKMEYAPATWRPDVTYGVEGTTGTLSVIQPDKVKAPSIGEAENTWTLALTPDVPTKLALRLGVGESNLDLRGIDLTDLNVATGLGQATVDLSGPLAHDLWANITCGVGDVDITVPGGVGVRVVRDSNAGLGDFVADGFEQRGEDLVNAAWTGTGPKLDLNVTRGLGDVTIETAGQ